MINTELRTAHIVVALLLAASMCGSCNDDGGDGDADGDVDGDVDGDGDADPFCGDGVTQEGEACDLGEENGGDECAWDCTDAAPFLELDAFMEELIETYRIPGAALAVARDERLMVVRGYGTIYDSDATPMGPHTLFRIASISKPITAVAILHLLEEGLLDLDDPVFPIHLPHLIPEEGVADERVLEVTIYHLLTHTGGWNRDTTFDPMMADVRIATELGIEHGDLTPEDIIRYMLGEPLDFDPGAGYTYSNFGYSILGRVVEAIAATTYEEFVQTDVLLPMGITRMETGHTTDLHPEETHYAGGWSGCIELMDSPGGWIASTSDLLRFVTTVDGRDQREDFLEPETISLMTERPTVGGGDPAEDPYYALGWRVTRDGLRVTISHGGALATNRSFLVGAADGYAWAALFNTRPDNDDDFTSDMNTELPTLIRSIGDWPDHDLFAAPGPPGG